MVDINVDSPTRVWGLTPDGMVRNNTVGGVFNKYPVPNPETYGALKCFVKVGGSFYIGSEKKGLLKFSPARGAYSEFADLWKSAVTSICLVDSVTLAVGTFNDGLTLIDLRNGEPLYSARYENGLASNSVSSIAAKDNNIWFGSTFYIGLNRLSRDVVKFRHFETGDFKTSDRPVISFLHTPKYTFIGTRDGFYVTNRETGKTSYLAKGMPGAEVLTSNIIFSFFKYGEEYLVGTCNGGLYRVDPETMTVSSSKIFSEMSSNDIFSHITLDERNRLWLPTRGGLFCYDKGAGTVKGYTTMNSNLPSNIVYSVLIDGKDRFWVATDKGARLFNPDTGKFSLPRIHPDLLHHSVVRFLNEDSRGNVFFCTIYDELWMADRDLRHCKRLFADKNIHIRNITDDGFGNYWIGTSEGLIKTDPKMKVLANYSATDEIPSLEVTSGPQLRKDSDGKIWMAGIKGLVEITPTGNETLSAPKIVRVSVDGKTVMDISTTGLGPLVVDKAHNTVSFHLMDSTYSNPAHVRLEYILEGYDKDWRIKSGAEDITYYDLPPGKYRFMVRPYLCDQVSQTLDVRVNGIHSAWIWIVIIILILIGGFVAYRYRKNIIPQAKRFIQYLEKRGGDRELQEEMEPEENRVSKVKVSDSEMEEMHLAVKRYLEESKAYLNPDLKKPELAAATGYSSQMLSLMFNQYLNIGYYDFINSYRVETFKRLIREGANEKYTLKTIADMSGFSSHTSFFRTFKKFTGVTPNDYIRSQQKENQ